MKTKLMKKQNGFVISDAILAVLILIMFTSIITSLIYNIVLTSRKIKLNSQQIADITAIFNYAEKIKYDDVTTENLVSYINSQGNSSVSAGTDASELTNPYKLIISVQKYNETEGNTDKEDILKIVTVTAECELSGKTYTTEMQALIKKQTLAHSMLTQSNKEL